MKEESGYNEVAATNVDLGKDAHCPWKKRYSVLDVAFVKDVFAAGSVDDLDQLVPSPEFALFMYVNVRSEQPYRECVPEKHGDLSKSATFVRADCAFSDEAPIDQRGESEER